MSCSLVYTTENNQTYPRTKLTALLEYLLNLHFVYSRIQEVIGALVTHIGSGTSTEANTALEVLDTLVNNKLQAVQRFTLLIKVMIVYCSCCIGQFICEEHRNCLAGYSTVYCTR